MSLPFGTEPAKTLLRPVPFFKAYDVMSFVQKVFGLQGRLNRASYIGHTILCGISFWVGVGILIGTGLAGKGSSGPIMIAAFLAIPLVVAVIWAGFALGVKRLHDMDLSGSHMIWIYIPSSFTGLLGTPAPDWLNAIAVIAWLVSMGLTLWLWCIPGTNGPNRFGAPRVLVHGMTVRPNHNPASPWDR